MEAEGLEGAVFRLLLDYHSLTTAVTATGTLRGVLWDSRTEFPALPQLIRYGGRFQVSVLRYAGIDGDLHLR